jgi:hypothetical protein
LFCHWSVLRFRFKHEGGLDSGGWAGNGLMVKGR